MKYIKDHYFLFAVLIGIFLFNFVQANQLERISSEGAYRLQKDQKAIIVDVREEHEQAQGRVKNALSIPLSMMENDKPKFDKMVTDLLKKEKQTIVYCRSGRRSSIVGAELAKKGLKVLNLGAYSDWKNSDLPVE